MAIFAFLLATHAVAAERWIRIVSPHFEMYTDSDEKKGREAVLHFERVREFFLQASPVKPPAEFPTRIVAFRDPQIFHMYSPSQSAMAYYAPGPLRDTIAMEDPSSVTYPITIHEYVHLVVAHSGLRLPLWLNEGWAEVYSTLKPVKDGVAVGDLNPDRMKELQRGQWFTLRELSAVDNRSPVYNESSRTGLFYAESWALTHMLYLSPEYKDHFGRFIGALNRGVPIEQATLDAFGRTGDQVMADLNGYFARKNLFGTVFLTPFEKSGEALSVTPVAQYDSDLALADLYAASGHLTDAERSYKQLQTQDPKRPDAFAAAGYLGILMHDPDTARSQFRKAFANGSNDPQLCMQLAALDREAKQSPTAIMEVLERAVKLRPDFAEANFQLGLLKMDARDFPAAATLLRRVGAVSQERYTNFHEARAYTFLQTGDLTGARADLEAARKTASRPDELRRADQLAKLIEARSSGPGAAHPGEVLSRVDGSAVGLRCEAQGALSRFGVLVDGKQVLFDLPDVAAVELVPHPGTAARIECGPLTAFRVVVEYVAAPTGQGTAGLVRRLEY